ncbi:restriction endonuclease subunit S [Actinomadura bangladeshensis]|uniref:Restriction endonuclease subunit S n=1 Tax=Actinomadura bangladeshensis TaxID=453573 RepID=A0A4R4NVC7_9ACTN|nr:restriction endonuclease subunit S [Actinomadura bangladeshensis]TDC13004.1 restriction endonuclease subunit S [Actinomadura bangladeshensis]
MSDWPSVPFERAVINGSSGNAKIQRSSYKTSGLIPIIDQGESVIAGFTDDPELAYKGDLPVIIFGDHTRRFKFVDFPFAVGAEGVRVLRSAPDFEPRFLFRYLSSLNIPSAGYSRHFKFLRESTIAAPSFAEQKRIADVLDRVDELRAKRRVAITLLDDLAQAIFFDMFGDPRVNPKSFSTKALSELVDRGDRINYGVVQPGADDPSGIPLVRVGDLIDDRVNHSSLKRIDPEIEAKYKRSRLRGNEILVGCVGSIGSIAVVGPDEVGFNVARAVARIPITSNVERLFVAQHLKMPAVQDYFASQLRTVAQPTLNIKQLSKTVVMVPPIELQENFFYAISRLHGLRRKHVAQLASLDVLFGSLQNKAFRGELWDD